MKLIVKDLKFQETSEILLKHFPEAPEEELVIYPEYTEKSGLRVLKCGNNVKIQYHQDVQYYRALGMVLGDPEKDISCSETAYTSRLGTMFDCSRNGVLKVGTVKRYIEYLALLGMNDLLLYTEDTYEIPKYPHLERSEDATRKKRSGRWNGMLQNSGSNWFRVYRHLHIYGPI